MRSHHLGDTVITILGILFTSSGELRLPVGEVTRARNTFTLEVFFP